jgi:hypothetical protein
VPFGAGVTPGHFVPLTMGGRYGSTFLLDTNEGSAPTASFKALLTISGTVTDYIPMERPERKTPPIVDRNYWRAYRTLPIAEGF